MNSPGFGQRLLVEPQRPLHWSGGWRRAAVSHRPGVASPTHTYAVDEGRPYSLPLAARILDDPFQQPLSLEREMELLHRERDALRMLALYAEAKERGEQASF